MDKLPNIVQIQTYFRMVVSLICSFIEKAFKMPKVSQEPIAKFAWTLSVVRLFFKLIFQDIFGKEIRYSKGFIVLFGLYSSCMISCFHSLLFNPDKSMAFMSGATGLGVLEVCIVYCFDGKLLYLLQFSIQFNISFIVC